MDNDERITQLENQIEQLKARQAELHKELTSAQLDHWKGRVDDLEVQMHLAAMDGNERLAALTDELRRRWDTFRVQIESTSATASDVALALRAGLEGAYREVRKALLESKHHVVG